MTVFVVIDSQQREVEDPAAISTEPFLRIVGCDLHFKDEKLYSLSLKVDPWPPHGFIEGSPLTVIIGGTNNESISAWIVIQPRS